MDDSRSEAVVRSMRNGAAEHDGTLQTGSPAPPSPDTPIAPVQFQHSRAVIPISGVAHRSAVGSHVSAAPGPSRGSDESVRPLRGTRRARSSQRESAGSRTRIQEAINGGRRHTSSRSNTLNLFTNGGQSIDQSIQLQEAQNVDTGTVLPSPPPSVANTSPILSPIEDVAELPVLRGNDARSFAGNTQRERAASSALDFESEFDPQSTPDVAGPKDRTMSESRRPLVTSRAQSTPMFRRKGSSTKPSTAAAASAKESTSTKPLKELPAPLKTDRLTGSTKSARHDQQPPSPIPEVMPIPPMSIPTFLQLELSSSRPSPLYMYRPSTTEHTFESTSAKAERLYNFLALAPQLERVLWFGTFACLDAWLYNFTILPLRFSSAFLKLIRSLIKNLWSELVFLAAFVPLGLSRLWQRQIRGHIEPPTPPVEGDVLFQSSSRSPAMHFPFPESSKEGNSTSRSSKNRRHRRSRSVASSLMSAEKSDILKGLLIVSSTLILMRFDASMMYHSIRGQAAIKLYVIYNALEVFDRLLSAIGQDILECLFSPESLSRHANGRSKILRPLSLFPIAMVYVCIHATALYYQVITLNVAVNSYSNALLTLLMSNQFVEIKSTVFKRIEKENLFQMTCADVVERFQLWLMLVIIASRNIIETSAGSSAAPAAPIPPTSPSVLPFSFTIFSSFSFSQILNPFILVIGTETIVDLIKHAYITKFNNVKPNLYGRYLDVLAKDYYGHAFTDPSLMKRIGLPVIPLTCLAIRAAVQTYHMFREHLIPAPLASSVTTDFSSSAAISPTTVAALRHIDSLFLKVVGEANDMNGNISVHSSWLGVLPSELATRYIPTWLWTTVSSIPFPTTDTLMSWGSTALVLALLYLVLLALKLVLGMALLSYARNRYAGMKVREQESTFQDGRRNGGWGTTELDEDKRRWIYADDPDKARKLRERDRETREKEMAVGKKDGGKTVNYDGVERYKLGGSKRIW